MTETLKNLQVHCNGAHDDTLARAVQDHLLDGITANHIAGIFAALSDPTRVRIISLLTHAELCVGDLCLVLGMSQPAVSHQLRVLRNLRIVAARKEGRHVFYTLVDQHVHDLFHQGLAHASHS
jgi:DNA-binding transcriptional ArsR family regulator